MSLTSYRAAPPRARVCPGLSGGVIVSFLRELSLFRSGGDLLSHVLRRSTIGVGTLIGRVRDGIGSFMPAMTTRPEKRPGIALCAFPKHQ